MSDETTFYEVQPDPLLRKFVRTPEGQFFIVFVTVAVLGWIFGMGSFQLNELRIKNEIAAAQKLAEEQEVARLDALNVEFSSSKYSKYEYTSGDFKLYYNTQSNCKTQRSCAYPVVLSKYNCESVDFQFTFTKESGDVVSTVNLTESYVSSLTPFKLYVESTNDKSTDYVNLISATCNGESF
jgi:hypothetical protein